MSDIFDDGGIDNPEYFAAYLYYKIQEEADYIVKRLNGKTSGGSKFLEVM